MKGGAKQAQQGDVAILKDFTDPATKAGAGVHLKNLYNDYIYFWRWALWRLFERQNGGGIVTFITASSYLAGPGFVGVREVMRRTFDELWIIDLGGDNLGTRKTPNVFNIQNPVAIAIGVRAAKPNPNQPAKVRYAKIEGATREDKLTQLDGIADFKGLVWRDCPDDWHKPFLPIGKGDFFSWPLATQLFPWQHSGCELKRSWPISESKEVLTARWDKLLAAGEADKDKLIRRTDARNKDKSVDALLSKAKLLPIKTLKVGDVPEAIVAYAYRSFDRQLVILDGRLGDRFRPLCANKSETFDCLKFALGGAGERSDGNARTSVRAFACRA